MYRNRLATFMRQKLVTLDPTAFEISKEMNNFSGWVRKQLHYYRDGHEIEYLLAKIEHMENTFNRIIANEIEWNGQSWMPTKEEFE